MNLSTAQQNMLNRASGKDEQVYCSALRTHDSLRILNDEWYRENLSTHAVCDLYGSGEHRTAYALQKKGIGKVFTKAPCNCSFFKVYKNDAERIADEESHRLFWERMNARD